MTSEHPSQTTPLGPQRQGLDWVIAGAKALYPSPTHGRNPMTELLLPTKVWGQQLSSILTQTLR